MRRLTPALAVLGLVLAGCTGDTGTGKQNPGPGKSNRPDASQAADLYTATVVVEGMT
jgi:hypothetical protein